MNEQSEPSELLSRALKRKFTELDEITQRLRLRLSKVTDEDSDTSSDGTADQFEKDINTLSIEEDFDLINFEDETNKLSVLVMDDTLKNDSDCSLLITKNPKLETKITDSKGSTSDVQSDAYSSPLSVESLTKGTIFVMISYFLFEYCMWRSSEYF